MVRFGPSDFIQWCSYTYDTDERRNNLLKWLDKHEIMYTSCAEVASENGFEAYKGQLYIDVVYDKNLPTEQQEERCRWLIEHLETPEGQAKDEEVRLCMLDLHIAMQNAHHDEPGFWKAWAETF